MGITITKSAVEYPGTGAQQNFDIAKDGEGIYFEETSDIDVFLLEDNVSTPQAEGTDYTVSDSYTSSAYVTMLTAPTADQTVRIERNTPLTQESAFGNGTAYNPADVVTALDKLTRISQDLSRAVNDNEGEADDDHAMTLDPEGEYWDGESKPIQNLSPGSSPTDAATVSQVTDAISISGLALIGQSTTSVAIGTGNKSFTIAAGSLSSFTPTEYMIAQDNSNSANYMVGQLVSYNSSTGALVINVTDTGGSGTIADWSISASSRPAPLELVDDATPQLGGPLDTNDNRVEWSKGADIASADTLVIGDDGNYFDVTGTTDINFISNIGNGTVIRLHFDAALRIHHSANIQLPGNADLLVEQEDELEFVQYATNGWRLTRYLNADKLVKPSSMVLTDEDTTIDGGGVATTPVDDGEQTTGTYTPTYVGGNFREVENGGAFQIGVPLAAGSYDIRLLISNNASAGAITFSGGYNITDGDAFTTTNGHRFLVYITRFEGAATIRTLTVKALQ